MHRLTLRYPLALAALLVAGTVTTPSFAAPALPTDARTIFLHHSTGGVIWGGGVSSRIDAYNTAHGTSYEITELAYPNSPYPWDNYPYDYWNLWVQHAGGVGYQGQATLEMLTPQYDVIAFKHCFPVSGIGPDTGSPNVASPDKTTENYVLQYAALKAKLHTFPDNRFIVWTGAALRQQDTSPEQAARARDFFAWVRDVWDEPGDNIYVWDFFSLETNGGMYLAPEHASGDSHPSDTFATEVAPLFAQRVVDVIEGRADSSTAGVAPAPLAAPTLALAGRNPFSAGVGFRVWMPAAAHASLDVFDCTGRRVAGVIHADLAAGAHAFAWDASGLASGSYVARLDAGGRITTRRLALVR